ncbi:3-deoxy-7-phosphoheptulonate synthase [bacterium]|nr:3-deoxy-7-phosphoheptulonate synthase [FCB group bacterium]MBL7190796.1 3-deoxy-7-phosphoheptulonate synthase [bacterium]
MGSITIRNHTIGDGSLTIIAGPCSIENREQLLEIAHSVKESGAAILRGGAFKPRTSPYSFQGLGEEGLQYMKEAGQAAGLLTVTEVMDSSDIDLVASYADILQIGSRNMDNFSLLKKVGQKGHPVMLKRGYMSTIEEFLLAAEYFLKEGDNNVILCERGIRTFEKFTRNTLDLSAVPIIKKMSNLPVIVDPSHGTGRADIVLPMSKAAVAAGADGLMIEVHPNPKKAISDGQQTLDYNAFRELMQEITELHAFLNHRLTAPQAVKFKVL